MATKPDGKMCEIREQIIEDLVTGLTFQFERKEDSDCPVRLRIFGNLPYGNRELLFAPDGELGGTGTYLGDAPCRATWLQEVK